MYVRVQSLQVTQQMKALLLNLKNQRQRADNVFCTHDAKDDMSLFLLCVHNYGNVILRSLHMLISRLL